MAQDIVGSKMPANNSYGQNGDPSASSDTDFSNRTNSPMAKQLFPVDLKGALAKAALSQRGPGPAGKGNPATRNARKQPTLAAPQTRTVDATPLPTTFGHHAPKTDGTVPAKLGTVSAQPVRKP
jgi:hypothetical protein